MHSHTFAAPLACLLTRSLTASSSASVCAVLVRVRSVAGIGLWWKTRFLRLTPSFLTITDLKQQTLLASIPTTDFQYCAHVKTNRTRGRRFLIRLVDGQVLQLYTTTTGECVQWVSVINEVIVACDKQRAKNQLINQRRKDQLRDQLASSASLPNIMLTSGPSTPTGLPANAPLMPSPVSPARAQTANIAMIAAQSHQTTPNSTGKHVSVQLGETPGPPVALVRANSTGAMVDQRRLERKTSRELQKRERKLKAAHDTGGAGTGSEPRRIVDSKVNGKGRPVSVNGERREERKRRDEDYFSGYESYDRRHLHSSRDASDDEQHYHHERTGSGRYYSRYYDEHPSHPYGYPAMPLPYPHHLLPYPFFSSPANGVLHPSSSQMGNAPSAPPPTQRLLFFFLLFLLFSFTILLSGHTYRTSTALQSLYTRHVLQPTAALFPYRAMLSAVLQCWPFYGLVVSGCYLAYLLQASMWDVKKPSAGGTSGVDGVDWLGGSMAGMVCTGCTYFIATHLRSYYDVFM